MKKKEAIKFLEILLIISIFSLILSINSLTELVSADSFTPTCSVVERNNCIGSNYIVMGLSSSTNAHGELASEGNYEWVLCCNFGAGDTSCTGTNKIIGLSSSTNAHGEIPEETNYADEVCYEDLFCKSFSGSCTSTYPIEMISLTDDENAHIGNFSDYDTKICCNVGFGVGIKWRNKYGYDLDNDGGIEEIETLYVNPGVTKVNSTQFDSDLGAYSPVNVDVYEDKTLWIDNKIKVLTGTVDSEENINLLWKINQLDIDNIDNIDNPIYFLINDDNLLRSENNFKMEVVSCIEISSCRNYLSEGICNADPCEVGGNNIPGLAVDCSDIDIECFCKWEEGECRTAWNAMGNESVDDGDIDDDGIPNINDGDMDGDGILNGDDPDFDGDGTPDWRYSDIDPDGIPNIDDEDMDGDGILNGDDPDFDGDGILDWRYSDIDPNGDIDGDGILNEDDEDMDGDGILNEDDPDFNGDGILDYPYDDINPGIDTDGDGIPNEDDEDIDGDGIPNGDDDDIDGDGILNGDDPDSDGDGIPDGRYSDIDPDGDIDGDGIPNIDDDDMDGDGILNGDDPDFDLILMET